MDASDPHQTALMRALRRRATAVAEGRFAQETLVDAALSPEQSRQVLHDLRVHQIELEMQNEELRRVELQLDEERASYFDLYELAPVAYLSLSDSGSILKANLTSATLLRVDRRALINKPFKRFILWDDQGVYEHHLRQLTEGGPTEPCELRMVTQEGVTFWAHLEARLTTDRAGAPQHRVMLADISDRVRLEQALQVERQKVDLALKVAQEATQAKSDFLSHMSHELRSPLNAILGFAQLMASADTPAPTPSQKGRIDHILMAGWYLLGLITEILDLSMIESGNLSLAPQAICLADVLADCAAMIQPTAEQSRIHLRMAELDLRCFVQADRVRLTQLFMNLLSNAVKYNRPGGTVNVSFATVGAGRLRIEVRDTGAGLSADKLAQLFQPFNRLGQEHGVIDGTGIGLVVSKRLVELMGGRIGAESLVGVGSMFWIELVLAAPVVLAAAQPPTLTKQAAPQGGSQQRSVLYVEDNPANMELVEQLIARRPDLKLLGAYDGAQGLAIARRELPDVIMLDLHLPDMSGMDVLQFLRADPSTRHVPVLAVSANAMPEDIRDGMAAGFVRYLAKPVRLDELMQALDLALEPARSQAVSVRVQ
jgi:PAS domain S-box-containing protein